MKTSDGRGVAPPLGDMGAEDFRRYGREVVDWIADYFSSIEQRPVLAQTQPGELISKLPPAPPERGETMDAILAHGRSQPTVFLPSHDPESVLRLESRVTL